MYKIIYKLDLAILTLNFLSLDKSPEGQARLSVTKKKAKKEPIATIWLKSKNLMPCLQNLIMLKRLSEFWDRGKARKEVGLGHHC